jgi:uncharacterized membrane protein
MIKRGLFTMKHIGHSGVLLAAAALTLAIAGTSFVQPALADGKVKCAGINGCKGTSDCATKTSSCKGQNSCKGHGFKFKKSAKSCKAAGGHVI